MRNQPAIKNSAIKKMRVAIELELSRMLTDREYDALESKGISVYGASDGKTARYEFGCHNSEELQYAQAFLAAFK